MNNLNGFIGSLKKGTNFLKSTENLGKQISNSPVTKIIPQLKPLLDKTTNILGKTGNALEKTSKIAADVNDIKMQFH